MTTIPTGLRAVDQHLNLGPGKLAIIGGHSQSGMTTLLLSIIRAATLDAHVPTLFVDLETGAETTSRRLAASLARLNPFANHGPAELAALADARDFLDAAPLTRSHEQCTVDRLRNLISAAWPRPRLVLIDACRYMTLGDPDEDVDAAWYDRLGNALKDVAQDLDVAVIATQPFHRSEESMRNPSLDSLDIAYPMAMHADSVVLIHRPGQWDTNRLDPRAELRIAKNRMGPVTATSVRADLLLSRFRDDGPEWAAA